MGKKRAKKRTGRTNNGKPSPRRGQGSAADTCGDGRPIRFLDLFAGIGGFRLALEALGAVCVWACEINEHAAGVYLDNFGDDPTGDITAVGAPTIHDHDILCAGFPCQSYSGLGKRKGLADPRGRLFYAIVRVLLAKRPAAFILENVPRLLSHDNGRTFARMRRQLTGLGYRMHTAILDARRFGLPQRRRRLFIVGLHARLGGRRFVFPTGGDPALNLRDLLIADDDVPPAYDFTDEQRAKLIERKERHRAGGSGHGYAIAVDHANTIVSNPNTPWLNVVVRPDGRWRRLTPRECARLQGFPSTFRIHAADPKAYRQLGNSVAVPVVRAVAGRVVATLSGASVPQPSSGRLSA